MKIKTLCCVTFLMGNSCILGMLENPYPETRYPDLNSLPSAPSVEISQGYLRYPDPNQTSPSSSPYNISSVEESCSLGLKILTYKPIKERGVEYNYNSNKNMLTIDYNQSQLLLDLTGNSNEFKKKASIVTDQNIKNAVYAAYWMKQYGDSRVKGLNEDYQRASESIERQNRELETELIRYKREMSQQSFWSRYPLVTFVAGGIVLPPLCKWLWRKLL